MPLGWSGPGGSEHGRRPLRRQQVHPPRRRSLNMWQLVTGVEKSSPRQELPLVIAHPMFNTTALIVGDFKLLLGPQTESYWQGPDFPNGTAPYGVNGENICDCGDDETLEGGCLFNIRKDPAETVVSRHDIAGIWVASFSRCQRCRCGQGSRRGTPPSSRARASPSPVSRHDTAAIWVAFFSRWQRYRCCQERRRRPSCSPQ